MREFCRCNVLFSPKWENDELTQAKVKGAHSKWTFQKERLFN